MDKQLLNNFISLLDVIEAVACRIPMSDDEIDSYRNKHNDSDSFTTMLNRWPVRKGFQRSRAAFALVDCLTNSPTSKRPRWFDLTELGFPLHCEAVGVEGMAALVRTVRWKEDYVEQFIRNSLFTRWRNNTVDESGPETPLYSAPKLPRACQIGFDRGELIGFLDTNGVTHSLGTMPPPPDNDRNTDLTTVTTPRSEADLGQSLTEMSAKDKRPNFRGPLSDVLYLAWTRALDSNSYRSVFKALVKLAREENRPEPLCGYEPEQNAVKWLEWDNKANEDKVHFFTEKDMRSRLRSVRKL